ncbi:MULTISPECIES: hypothetical protein [Streptomyces]|uniref:hypothetical protein n=1 Tax=Streptomyces TaxID=1883 RepID=UPI0013D97C32|nr:MULTISPECIES: hypothetical protein [Streptomyces]MCX4615611.1 hypothetical protein [Streptomyces mirabilis]MCX5356138.1 hypothetical protein [Streptomyces mirabilis]
MKIGPENNRASLRRRWGVPLGVATGVAAMSVAAVAVFSGIGDAKPLLAGPAGDPTGAASSPSPGTTHGSASAGAGSASSSARASSAPDAFSITSGTTTPIDARTVARILASCLGSDASRFHAVVAGRAPIASQDWDGVVIAVDSADQYVQCESKGDKGNSQDSPPTFINNRLWGTGHMIEYFDSIREPAGKGQYLMLGAGHYTSDIAKITISYGDNPKQYPAVMAGGAFVYAAALSTDDPGPHYVGPSPYVHAYNASGAEIYNQKKDPQFTDKQ